MNCLAERRGKARPEAGQQGADTLCRPRTRRLPVRPPPSPLRGFASGALTPSAPRRRSTVP
jgi:hypothetical protein